MGRPLSFFSEAFQVVAVVLRHITTSFITTQRRTFTMLRRHMTFNNNEAALTSDSASKVLVRLSILVLVLCAMDPVAASSRQVLFGIDAGPDPTDVPSPTDAAPTASAPTTSAPTTSCVDAVTAVTFSKHSDGQSFAEGSKCDVKDCVEVGDITMIMNKEDCMAAAAAFGSDYMFGFWSAGVEAADAPFGCWVVEYVLPENNSKTVFWNSGTKNVAIVSLDGGGCVHQDVAADPTCKYSHSFTDGWGLADESPQPIYPVCAHHTLP